jgi:hypothetical protein
LVRMQDWACTVRAGFGFCSVLVFNRILERPLGVSRVGSMKFATSLVYLQLPTHRGVAQADAKGHKRTSNSSAATSGPSGNDAEHLGDPEQIRNSLPL